MKEQGGRIPSLDGLRAISILMVVMGHSIMEADSNPALGEFRHLPIHHLGAYQYFGVRVFFVISGFLITTLLLKERQATGAISLKDFYIRRAYRILPASYAVILVVAVVCRSQVHPLDVLSTVFYVSNFNSHMGWPLSHMWSLSVEEQFYLLWPLLLNRFFRHRYKILAAAIIVAPFFRAVSGVLGNRGAEANWFPSAMDYLAIGCLLALFRDRLSQWSQRLDKFIIPIAAATLLMPLFHYPPGVQPLLVLTLVGFGIAFCVDNCIRKAYWILNWKPVVWLGTLSYSIYLVQMPFFTPGSTSWLTAFPWNLLCILPAAMACHYLIEKPFLRLRAIRAARKREVAVQAT